MPEFEPIAHKFQIYVKEELGNKFEYFCEIYDESAFDAAELIMYRHNNKPIEEIAVVSNLSIWVYYVNKSLREKS